MPRFSKKARYIRALTAFEQERQAFRELREAFDIVDATEDDIDEMVAEVVRNTEGRRYLFRRKYRDGQASQTYEEDLVPPLDDNDIHGIPSWLSDDQFLKKYRMKRNSFHAIVDLIRDHPVFRAKRFGRRQAPVEHQLMTLLRYLGTEGSGGSNEDLRCDFGCGRGTAELYKRRCVTALSSLRNQVITWPDEAERQEISHRILEKYQFPNCVGLIDGTLFPLSSQPQTVDAPDYSGRKYGYSLSVMIICDDQRLIRQYLAGWPGSTHDNRIYKHTQLYQFAEQHFTDQQYLLGDSAFENGQHLVSAYRCPQGQALNRERTVFNHAMSKPRVISEHTIGILKGRFPWLRSIRMIITEDRNSLRRILQYIDTCIILHNLLTKQHEPTLQEWIDDDDASAIDGANPDPDFEIPNDAPNDWRRIQLTERINNVHII